jgi:hypothetical protein
LADVFFFFFFRLAGASCDPNCTTILVSQGNAQAPFIAFFAKRDIAPNEELVADA